MFLVSSFTGIESLIARVHRTAAPCSQQESAEKLNTPGPKDHSTYDAADNVMAHPGLRAAASGPDTGGKDRSYWLMQPVYSKEYVESVVPHHQVPKAFFEKAGYYGVQAMRTLFDVATGYGHQMTEERWLRRILFLETVAGGRLGPTFFVVIAKVFACLQLRVPNSPDAVPRRRTGLRRWHASSHAVPALHETRSWLDPHPARGSRKRGGTGNLTGVYVLTRHVLADRDAKSDPSGGETIQALYLIVLCTQAHMGSHPHLLQPSLSLTSPSSS